MVKTSLKGAKGVGLRWVCVWSRVVKQTKGISETGLLMLWVPNENRLLSPIKG